MRVCVCMTDVTSFINTGQAYYSHDRQSLLFIVLLRTFETSMGLIN